MHPNISTIFKWMKYPVYARQRKPPGPVIHKPFRRPIPNGIGTGNLSKLQNANCMVMVISNESLPPLFMDSELEGLCADIVFEWWIGFCKCLRFLYGCMWLAYLAPKKIGYNTLLSANERKIDKKLKNRIETPPFVSRNHTSIMSNWMYVHGTCTQL